MANGAFDAIIARHYSEGGQGAVDLAAALIKACDSKQSDFHYLYDVNGSIEEKIFKIASEMYGAAEIEFHGHVKEKIQLYNAQVSGDSRCWMEKVYTIAYLQAKSYM